LSNEQVGICFDLAKKSLLLMIANQPSLIFKLDETGCFEQWFKTTNHKSSHSKANVRFCALTAA